MGSEGQAVQMAVGSRGSGPGGHHLVTDRLHLTTCLWPIWCILYNTILLGVKCYQLFKFGKKSLTCEKTASD